MTSTSGLGIRIAITFVAVAQAMVAAILGFGDIVPQEWKFALVALSAGLVPLANQLPSWQNAPQASQDARARGD